MAKTLVSCTQQAVFAYESGERPVSIFICVKMSKVFKCGVEEVIGATRTPRKRRQRLSPRIVRIAERPMLLMKTQQRFVTRIVDMLEASNKAA